MRMHSRVAHVVLMVGLVMGGAFVACGHPHHDYDTVSVTWSDREEPYYERWEHDTHRDHVVWDQRSPDDQRAYWSWRHDHS
jgi:hypothetical protein